MELKQPWTCAKNKKKWIEDFGRHQLLAVIKEKLCIEDFGQILVKGACKTKCKSKHKNGSGDCDAGDSYTC